LKAMEFLDLAYTISEDKPKPKALILKTMI